MQPFQPTEKALARWNESFLKFEDQEAIEELLWTKIGLPVKDYEIGFECSLEIEAEVVEQWKSKSEGSQWHDLTYGEIRTKGNFSYRKVWRLTNKI